MGREALRSNRPPRRSSHRPLSIGLGAVGADSAAGVIMDGALFCGTHANEALERGLLGVKTCKPAGGECRSLAKTSGTPKRTDQR